jgi:hypothetical protein
MTAEMEAKTDQILRKAALDISGQARINTQRVKSGTMKAGWTWRKEGTEQLSYLIFNAVGYTIFHELGTAFIGPAPMLVPALEQHRPNIIKAFESLFQV